MGSVVVMTHDLRGNVLDVGRKTRRIPASLRRALATRDGGCRYPGCPNQIVDVHHVQHWADGGETKLGNCIQLCRFHHGQLHEGGWRSDVSAEGSAHFVDANGKRLASAGTLEPTKPKPRNATPWGGAPFYWRSFDLHLAVRGFCDRD